MAAGTFTSTRVRRTERSNASRAGVHDPLNDLGKEEVLADILASIETRLPTFSVSRLPLNCLKPSTYSSCSCQTADSAVSSHGTLEPPV